MSSDRSAFRPFLVPLALLVGAHLLWLFVCGGFRLAFEILSFFLS